MVDFYGRRAGQEQGEHGERELALHSRLQAGKAEQTTHEILDWASLPAPFIGYVLVLASTHFKPANQKEREERVRKIKNAPMAEDCQ